jgi:hypothetical protein
MTSIHAVQSGVIKYIDDEILPKMQGWQKWVFGAGVSLVTANLPSAFEKLKANPLVDALGIIDSDGNIDITKAYRELMKQAEKGSVLITLPIVGSMTINKNDLEKLYRFIMEGAQ